MDSRQKDFNSRIKVSICCAVFNHEKYLRQCLEGLIMQKTSFAYEILIHNDASTDGTDEIIREYTERFPCLIKEIRQSSNKYSTTTRAIITTYLLPLAKGEYVALCEGDDYWTDPYKLQTQTDLLDSHPDISVCFHSAEVRNADGKLIGYFKAYNNDRLVPYPAIIRWRHSFCPTCSIFYRKSHMRDYPDFCIKCHVGDYPLMLWLSQTGKAYYMDYCMAVYRKGLPGSWTDSYKTTSPEKRMSGVRTDLAMLDGVDNITDHRYKEIIDRKKKTLEIYALWRYRDIDGLRDVRFVPAILYLPLNKCIIMLCRIYLNYKGIKYLLLKFRKN